MTSADLVVATFAPDLAVLSGVRDLVASTGRAWGLDEVDELLIIVGELVANAIDHTGTPVHLSFWPEVTGRVRVEVSDSGPGEPELRSPYRDGTRGMGLHLVEHLALSWGVRPLDPGKTVWALVAVVP